MNTRADDIKYLKDNKDGLFKVEQRQKILNSENDYRFLVSEYDDHANTWKEYHEVIGKDHLQAFERYKVR